MTLQQYLIRKAHPSDADAIGAAHLESIRSIGPTFYPAAVVNDWAEGLTGQVYVQAMESGEVFFIAVGEIDGVPAVLGFASDYRVDGPEHETSVYERGSAARQGVGSALLKMAQADALHQSAQSVRIEASLAGVEFYRANGFHELGRGETRLMSGHTIACVFMRKLLKPFEA